MHIPSDCERWPEMVAAAASGPERAAFMLLRLWVELAYEVEATGRVGFLTSASAERYEKSVGVACATHPLLVPVPDGFECPRFTRLNGHLNASNQPMHMVGAEVSRWVRGTEKAARHVMQQSLLIAPSTWRKPDGTVMAHDQIQRIMLLVNSCDRALYRPERPANDQGYPETVVLDAWRVLQEFLPDQLEHVLKEVVKRRGHPSIPPTTEQLLPRFRELAAALMK